MCIDYVLVVYYLIKKKPNLVRDFFPLLYLKKNYTLNVTETSFISVISNLIIENSLHSLRSLKDICGHFNNKHIYFYISLIHLTQQYYIGNLYIDFSIK